MYDVLMDGVLMASCIANQEVCANAITTCLYLSPRTCTDTSHSVTHAHTCTDTSHSVTHTHTHVQTRHSQ